MFKILSQFRLSFLVAHSTWFNLPNRVQIEAVRRSHLLDNFSHNSGKSPDATARHSIWSGFKCAMPAWPPANKAERFSSIGRPIPVAMGLALATALSCLPLAILAQRVAAVSSSNETPADLLDSQSASAVGISEPAFALINARTSQNQSQFFVYEDMDSGFNHGFPSGLFGSSQTAMNKLHVDAGCVYSATSPNGCSTDPTSMDQIRGTVFRLSFDPLAPGESVGLNFEEPERWGVTQAGRGYDLGGATQVLVDVIAPSGGIKVQFGIAGATTPYMTIPQQWTTIPINLSSLGVSSSALSGVHLLFGIASNDQNAPNGGTVLIDNIRFQPVPTSQTTRLGLPLANQVFGIVHLQNSLAGRIPIPPDEINSNLSTAYESSVVALALLNRRQPQDLANAKLIADTLVHALGHDNTGDLLPATSDGSGLHSGMFDGDNSLFNSQGPGMGQQDEVRLAGFTATALCPLTGFCLVLDGATGGNNSFAMLALLAAYNQFHDSNYLNAAITIANWIYDKLLDTSGTGYGGYFIGYPDQGLPKVLQTGKSTENNADIFVALSALAKAEAALGNSVAATTWTGRANIAGDFVMQMFDRGTGHFFAGTVPLTQLPAPGIYPNGTTKDNDVINTFDFLDAQTFTTLAMASAPRYRNQIDWTLPVQWMVNHFARSVNAKNLAFQGFDLIEAAEHQQTDGPPGIAWEFTSQAVVAMEGIDAIYNTSQFAAAINTYLNQIRQAQSSAPYADGQGLVAGTLQNGELLTPYQQCLVTPFQCIAERVGLAASTWAIFADLSVNPLSTASPVLNISKGHTGNFTAGQQNAMYSVTVSNAPGAGSTNGTVTVNEIVPPGLILVSMSGSGWACTANTCARSDALAGGASYPVITVMVDVAANASSPQVNQVSVSGGGSSSANSSDSTVINVNQAALSLSPNTLKFGYSGQQITSMQTIALSFNPPASTAWTTSSNQANITVRPTSGAGSAVLQITAMPGTSGVITVTAPGAPNSPQQIPVNVTSVSPTPPFGYFDTPVDKTTGIAGAIPVTGWGLDNIEATSVGIWREPVPSETAAPNGLVFIGNAIFVAGARPDVQAAFPNAPFNNRAGWGYMLLTNFLPNASGSGASGNGTYKLHAIITNASGQNLDLRAHAITVDNAHASKPFGTIDTPAQGGTVSGNAYVNFGWALTQYPYVIPMDGSTITVILDGVPVGHPTYDQYRSDIANLFPGLANSNGAVGFFYIDTTTLANGVHTISWNVFDNAGRGDGIGSRYITVANTGGGNVPASEEPIEAAQIAADATGVYSINIEELGRIELTVGATSGYLLMNNERQPLPVGSTLKGGRFYWQAGPGFLGDYLFVFDRPNRSQVRVLVQVQPKHYSRTNNR